MIGQARAFKNFWSPESLEAIEHAVLAMVLEKQRIVWLDVY
jgi:hypothetical protein